MILLEKFESLNNNGYFLLFKIMMKDEKTTDDQELTIENKVNEDKGKTYHFNEKTEISLKDIDSIISSEYSKEKKYSNDKEKDYVEKEIAELIINNHVIIFNLIFYSSSL